MYRVNIYLGLNDKDTKVQRIPTNDALRLVNEKLAADFEGATTYLVNGVYTHNNGVVVVENSIRVLLYLENPDNCRPFIEWAKSLFNQESVLLEYTRCDYFEFV